MISKEEIKLFYDDAIYKKLYGFIYKNPRVEYAWETLKETCRKYGEPKQILEIGCGTGEVSYRLASEFPSSFVTGFDISEQSVLLARQLFQLPNLIFLRSDDINLESALTNKLKFDLIVLMDVYEHISVSERQDLHLFINNHISNDGFLFLSCPTKRHQEYLRANHPEQMQPVDENITLDDMQILSMEVSLGLQSYNEVSVWNAGDYFHAIFTNKLSMQPFSDFPGAKSIQASKFHLRNEIKKTISKAINRRSQEDKSTKAAIREKKLLIQNKLGREMLDKIESIRN